MELSRKIRIGIGSVIILGGLISESSWWIIGILPLITGIFNTCPTCSTSEGASCKIESTKDKSE